MSTADKQFRLLITFLVVLFGLALWQTWKISVLEKKTDAAVSAAEEAGSQATEAAHNASDASDEAERAYQRADDAANKLGQ